MNMKLILTLGVLAAGTCFAGTVRIAHFRSDISPAVGENICGYAPNQRSVEKHDPLFACGLLIEEGTNRALLVALDLVGLDAEETRVVRVKCAAELGVRADAVFLSCTHNHSGPECVRLIDPPDAFNAKYVAFLEKTLVESVRMLKEAPRTECEVMFNSVQVDENYNRRFVTSDNVASFTPHRRVLIPGCDGPADKELGIVLFYPVARDPKAVPGYDAPCYVIGNYAAHALASHAPGIGGLRITADFPGFYRDYLKREMGCESMFVQGASGDLVPKGDELGMEAARRTGVNLAMATINAAIDCERNPERYRLAEPRLATSMRTFALPMRKRFPALVQPEYQGKDDMTLDIQCLSIGDVAFVGMPGELLCELGLEIKWHSPYRRTWIANLSTGIAGYFCSGNMLVQGGYEPKKQPFGFAGGLRIVTESVDALGALRQQVFPEQVRDSEVYPDYLDEPLVRIPGGEKQLEFKRTKR